MKRLLDGALLGAGFIAVVAVAFAIAWAGDVFTVDKDGALKFVVSDQGKITVGATESYVNLVIQNDEIVAESDNKLDITADVLTVEGIRLENVNVSANIELPVDPNSTIPTAGGRDGFIEGGNTWYYVWVITNSTGTSSNGLLSTSSTAPTLPSGFTKKRRVGAVRNNGSGDFLGFVQDGNSVNYTTSINVAPSDGTAGWTDVDASSVVPPTSRRVKIQCTLNVQHTASQDFVASIRRNGQTTGTQSSIRVQYQNNGIFSRTMGHPEVELDSAQIFERAINVSPNSGGLLIDVTGYYDRI